MLVADLMRDCELQALAELHKTSSNPPPGYSSSQWLRVLDKLNGRTPDFRDGQESAFPRNREDGPLSGPVTDRWGEW